MIQGSRIRLRPLQSQDWELFERWSERREALWGAYQRFQLDHIPLLRQAFQQSGLLTRESGFMLIEKIQDSTPIGFVRYTLIQFPDADFPHPEIGFGITETDARGHGWCREAVHLLVDYLFAGYDTQRISAITDSENLPAQKLLHASGFQQEGLLRRASYRDGEWRDMLMFSLLKSDWLELSKSPVG